MLITHLTLKNWYNFKTVDVDLQQRQFIVGPNASGKSNLLDAFRFLHDIAKQKGGGLQKAIDKRVGVSKIRCLGDHRDSKVVIGVSISDSIEDSPPKWRYEIGIREEDRNRQPFLDYEKVWHKGGLILKRPDEHDKEDKDRLKQTHLEQVSSNEEFREISKYLNEVTYMHLVPQLLRYSDSIGGKALEDDPFGQMFLERVAKTDKQTRDSHLKIINEIIKVAVPKLEGLAFEENTGKPHLSARYVHWRSKGAWQQEDQFSDGTLRLLAMIWYLLESDSLLLLEEPELSLHAGIVENLAGFLFKAQQKKKRQVIISTHSTELLSDPGIGAEEVLLLDPANEGTDVKVASDPRLKEVKALLEIGMSVGEIVIPRTKPENIEQLPSRLD